MFSSIYKWSEYESVSGRSFDVSEHALVLKVKASWKHFLIIYSMPDDVFMPLRIFSQIDWHSQIKYQLKSKYYVDEMKS